MPLNDRPRVAIPRRPSVFYAQAPAPSRSAAAVALLVTLVAGLLGVSAARAQVPADTSAAPRPAAPDTVTTWTVALDSVVVTATRTPRDLEDVPVPMSVVSAEQMQAQGALRLSDVLAEQTGLMLFEDHGTGVQMHGFDPDYTLILIDGEPVVGRTAGTLSLDRLAVGGVERVEIVRGPVSSLYGSDALAGVINLVTSRPRGGGVRGTVRSRYGTHATSDLAATIEAGTRQAGARLLLNRFASGGYDLSPDAYGATTPGFADYTADLRAHLRPSDRLYLTLGGRLAQETLDQAFAVAETGQPSAFAVEDASGRRVVPHQNRQERREWSLHPEARLRLTDRLTAEATLYAARFATETRQTRDADGALAFGDAFDQTFRRAEAHVDAAWGARHRSLAGGGVQGERLGGSRYTGRPAMRTVYAFGQHTWQPSRRLEVIASARLDDHSDFAARLSPNAAVLVRPAEGVRLRASVGSGFKAPAFRQLFLTFANATGGYDVFGTTRVVEGVARLEREGQIDEVLIDPAAASGTLAAETSTAYQVGASVSPFRWLDASVGAFRHDVRDLIDTQPVARKTNGAFVYSYFNLNRVRMQGLETEVTVRPAPTLALSAGYQRLRARDRDVVEAIEAGSVFGRTRQGRDVRLTLDDYGGLFGRSKHSGTAKLTWTPPDPLGLTLTVRGVWRSRYGFVDRDGNGLANRDDEFVPGLSTWDLTLTRTWPAPFGRRLTTQLGADNVFDLRRPALMPGQPGRTLYASLGWSF